MNRYTEEMKLYLFDIAHGNLSEENVLKGFIQHYVLQGEAVDKVVDDIVYHTNYGQQGVIIAKENIIKALNNIIHN